MKKSAASSPLDFGCYFIVTELCRRENHINGRRDRIISLRINLTILEKKKKRKSENEQQKRSFVRGEIARDQIMRDRRTRQGYPKILIAPRGAFRHLALLTIIRGPIRWPKRRSRYYAIMFHESSRNFCLALSLLLTLVSFRCFFLFLSSSLPHTREIPKMLSFLLSPFLYVDTFRKTLTNRSPQALRSAILNSKPHLRRSVSYSFFFFSDHTHRVLVSFCGPRTVLN